MIDKSKELTSSIKLVNDRLNFIGTVGENVPVSIDYIPPAGDNLGYTALELLLLSFTSCMGGTMLSSLRKMKKTIESFEMNTRGIRKEEHPQGFKTIYVEINIKSPDITNEEMLKVIKLAEDRYCPVWSMLKGNVDVEVGYIIS